MVANKEDTREELAMMTSPRTKRTESWMKNSSYDEPSCVQRLSFENEKKNNGDESLNREIETYRKPSCVQLPRLAVFSFVFAVAVGDDDDDDDDRRRTRHRERNGERTGKPRRRML